MSQDFKKLYSNTLFNTPKSLSQQDAANLLLSLNATVLEPLRKVCTINTGSPLSSASMNQTMLTLAKTTSENISALVHSPAASLDATDQPSSPSLGMK